MNCLFSCARWLGIHLGQTCPRVQQRWPAWVASVRLTEAWGPGREGAVRRLGPRAMQQAPTMALLHPFLRSPWVSPDASFSRS